MPTQVVITGVTGTPPFEISVCDITNSFCVVENPSVVIPPNYIFDLPFPFEGSTSFIVKITDNQGCEVFHPYYCLTPTPTPTLTPTPTSTQTNFCYCLVVRNTGATDGSFSYIDCNNVQNNNVIVPATVTIFVCGSNPTNVSGLSITYNGFCVDGSCLPPSQTPTQTPTPTPTISVTPTVTPTISVTPSVTPTISVTPTVTPTISVTPTITPTVTPTISVTPTMTPTPTTSPFPTNFRAYLFIEPQSASTIVGNYMFTNGSPQFFGFTNFTQPSANAINFDLEMNLYVDYVGWTNGQLPSIVPSDVPQTTGGNDSFGNPIIAYNFETVLIPSFTVGDKGWYTWLIPVSATNSQLQTQIDVSLNNPNIFTTVITEPTIRSNTFTYTGSVIPAGVYRVYTSYPSLNFYLNNVGNNIYFKGNLVGP